MITLRWPTCQDLRESANHRNGFGEPFRYHFCWSRRRLFILLNGTEEAHGCGDALIDKVGFLFVD
jgi:hypothetical protein